MLSDQLFFHIHYCNHRSFDDKEHVPRRISRTLSHHELILFTGGSGAVTIDRRHYSIKKGLLCYISPGLHHTFAAEAGPGGFLSVHFSYAEVERSQTQWKIHEGKKKLMKKTGKKLTDYYEVEALFRRLTTCWDKKRPGYPFAARTLFQQLLTAIAENIRKQNRNDASALKVEHIVDHMQRNLSKHVTLEKLSEIVQWSPTYLTRVFKESTGYSVISYFNKMKIDKAKELILDGNHKIKEVAHLLGFADEFYFSRLFKKSEGISPSEYYSRNVHG
ncbi:AraC family transcriptional regulator [Sporolactobacillus shoreicorticis]|uniref:AraC family transcriptional regulator n=1 Tax=Sporolactobacillus shoreicorticis TaxID=1923877 RepID=A0ABW5S153_9BACL|nr:AraC family transcriptional regulator [Sporolactobacillus shoreicorticis]MCO7125322.1 AraC family transcriptional regulator [Sporolactobacillus shoreicorticis]